MKTLRNLLGVAIALALFTTTLTAQELKYRAGSVPQTHTNGLSNILIQDYNLSGAATPSSTNATSYQLEINAGTRDYGNTTGVYAHGTATGSAVGRTRGYLSYNHTYNAHGVLSGVIGISDDVTNLSNTLKPAAALGGSFVVNITNPINADSGQEIAIAGSRSILDGSITTFPTNGVVAANFSQDRIKGTGTWAGYFDGRGHFSNEVGINTTSPLSKLSINGSGNSLYGAYITSPSLGNGSRGLAVDMGANSGFGDWNYGITSRIEAGFGYTVGTYGIAETDTPSNSGRAYGVRGLAGNADVNFALYGHLRGSNKGAALFAVDQVKHATYNEVISGSWAGYLIGDTHISDRMTIGTTNMPSNLSGYSLADYRLYVNGGILANEFLIPSVTWADYVFDEGYELTALEDVKTHIEANGYLHNTPSAETVEKEGLKVAEMTVNQQEKIEEIFLHLIEMNEELKNLKAENEALKAEIKSLK